MVWINRPYEWLSIDQISKVYSVNKHFSPNKTPISTCVNLDVIVTSKNLLIFESMEILCRIWLNTDVSTCTYRAILEQSLSNLCFCVMTFFNAVLLKARCKIQMMWFSDTSKNNKNQSISHWIPFNIVCSQTIISSEIHGRMLGGSWPEGS